jgi:hypothetical protein
MINPVAALSTRNDPRAAPRLRASGRQPDGAALSASSRQGVRRATQGDRRSSPSREIAADMRVGLDLQGCLQYSTEGLFCAQGIRIGWLQPWSARCYSCRRTAVCVQGVRGSAPCARSGMPSGHAISLSDSQEECVTRRSGLIATWPLTGIMSFRRGSLFWSGRSKRPPAFTTLSGRAFGGWDLLAPWWHVSDDGRAPPCGLGRPGAAGPSRPRRED